ICLARANDADQVLEIELVSDEVPCQGVEKFGVAWRIGDAEIVHRIDEAPAQELRPVAVHHGAGELGLPHQPIRELPAGIVAGRNGQVRSVQGPGIGVGSGVRLGAPYRAGVLKSDLYGPRRAAGDVAWFARGPLPLETTEKGGEAPVIVL